MQGENKGLGKLPNQTFFCCKRKPLHQCAADMQDMHRETYQNVVNVFFLT